MVQRAPASRPLVRVVVAVLCFVFSFIVGLVIAFDGSLHADTQRLLTGLSIAALALGGAALLL
jgi:small-conductance mechanosensitive channel